jgi:hypothetical protein
VLVKINDVFKRAVLKSLTLHFAQTTKHFVFKTFNYLKQDVQND